MVLVQMLAQKCVFWGMIACMSVTASVSVTLCMNGTFQLGLFDNKCCILGQGCLCMKGVFGMCLPSQKSYF